MDIFMENLLRDVKKMQLYDISHRVEGKYVQNIINRSLYMEHLYNMNQSYENWYLSIVCKIRMVRVIDLCMEVRNEN